MYVHLLTEDLGGGFATFEIDVEALKVLSSGTGLVKMLCQDENPEQSNDISRIEALFDKVLNNLTGGEWGHEIDGDASEEIEIEEI